MKTIIALALGIELISARPMGDFAKTPQVADICGYDSTSLQTNLDSLRDAFKAFEGAQPDFHLVDGDAGDRLIKAIANIPGLKDSNKAERIRSYGSFVLWVYRPSQDNVMWGVFDSNDCLVIYGVTQAAVWRKQVLNDS